MKKALLMSAILAALLSSAASAESPLTPAVWCTSDRGPGCDAGAVLSVAHRGRWSLVGAIGAKTAGAGLAYTAYEPTKEFPRRIGLAVGVVFPYSNKGVAPRFYPAIGVTLSWGKAPEGEP